MAQPEIRIVKALAKNGGKLVLAESCTGGLIAARLTAIPGVSDVFSGSHVVYREASKRAWLGISAATLKKYSAVSAQVAEAMARGALRKTPEATIAGAVTGYLGPSGKHVGLVYLSVFVRGAREATTLKLEIGKVSGTGIQARLKRREIAAEKLLATLDAVLARSES
jgi:nicotinamide-nucleotide amidase